MTDLSNGYEGVAAEFLAGRGGAPSNAIGTRAVRSWARRLSHGVTVIDLGCGSGLPITKVLASEGLKVYAIDASPSLVKAFRRNLPEITVACESVEDSLFFNRMFDGVLAWGLMFLLQPEEQRRLIPRIGHILVPNGRLLFTSPPEPVVWNDAMTGLESRSLGGVEYRRELAAVGLKVVSEYDDEGQNHYFDAIKEPSNRKDP
jgi:2-polyprenyl-3-methyl-5-hydroxy-6-metoxy-1,4-benzoquinol methylase